MDAPKRLAVTEFVANAIDNADPDLAVDIDGNVSLVIQLLGSGLTMSLTIPARGPVPVPPATDERPSTRSPSVSDDCLDEVITVLKAAGHRMTVTQVAAAMNASGTPRADGVLRNTLTYFTREDVAILNNRTDVRPRGYGLPEWD